MPQGIHIQPAGPTYRHVIIAGICALIATVGFGRFSYTPLLPLMRAQAGLSALDGGLLATFNYAGYLTGALIAASIHDLRLKALLYRTALVAGGISTLAMGLTQSPAIWIVLRFISGMASTAGLLLASGLILNWLIVHRHKPELGLHFMGMGIGIVVTGLGVMLATPFLSWAVQWICFGALSLCLAIPAWLWMPVPPKPSLTGPAAQSAATRDTTMLWLLLIAYSAAGVGYVVLATFIVDIVAQLPLFQGKATLVWIVVGLAAIPSAFLWDRIATAWGSIAALIMAFVLQIASVLLLMNGSVLANLAAALFYGGTFVGIVNLTLSVTGRTAPDNPARAMARMTVGYSIAQIVTPALAGYLADESGSYSTVLPLSAIVLGFGTAVLIFIHFRSAGRRL